MLCAVQGPTPTLKLDRELRGGVTSGSRVKKKFDKFHLRALDKIRLYIQCKLEFRLCFVKPRFVAFKRQHRYHFDFY